MNAYERAKAEFKANRASMTQSEEQSAMDSLNAMFRKLQEEAVGTAWRNGEMVELQTFLSLLQKHHVNTTEAFLAWIKANVVRVSLNGCEAYKATAQRKAKLQLLTWQLNAAMVN
jgi:hypothetical protein